MVELGLVQMSLKLWHLELELCLLVDLFCGG